MTSHSVKGWRAPSKTGAFVVMVAGDLDGAVVAAEARTPDLAVVDLKLSAASGLEVLGRLQAISGRTRVLILTGLADRAVMAKAIQLGAVACLRKPVDADEILAAFGDPPCRVDR